MEAELELALYLAGTISKDNFGNPRKVSWSRSGRTDKGVHAVAQVRGGGGGGPALDEQKSSTTLARWFRQLCRSGGFLLRKGLVAEG